MKTIFLAALLVLALANSSKASNARTSTPAPPNTASPAPSTGSAPTANSASIGPQSPALSPDPVVLGHVLNDQMTIISTLAQLPKPVLTQMQTKKLPLSTHISDAGKPWNEGDVVRDETLPFVRLIFAAASADYCVIFCEHGGIGYYREVYIYQIQNGVAFPVGTAFVPTDEYYSKSKPPYANAKTNTWMI